MHSVLLYTYTRDTISALELTAGKNCYNGLHRKANEDIYIWIVIQIHQNINCSPEKFTLTYLVDNGAALERSLGKSIATRDLTGLHVHLNIGVLYTYNPARLYVRSYIVHSCFSVLNV